MYFWLKFFHIIAMAVWFAGLFFLPRLFVAAAGEPDDGGNARNAALGRTLYFTVMTPAAAVTVALGLALIAYGFQGAWLPAKLGLVAIVVLLHVYFGQLLLQHARGPLTRGPWYYRILNWVPLLLFLAIAALAAAKPGALPPLGGT